MAAGEGGQPNPTASEDAPASSRPDDEDFRRYAVARLADHLEVGVSLAQRCEHLSAIPNGDRVAPITAAARLMNANARIAEALATVAQLERRRRSIVERIQPAATAKPELNSRFWQKKNFETLKAKNETMIKFWNRVDEHINQSMRARMGEEGVTDSVARIIRDSEKGLANAKEKLAELDEDVVDGE